MTIATKLRLNSIAITILVIIFIGVTIFLVFKLQQSYQKQQLAQKITENSFQLAILRSEYVAYPSDRPKNQWIDTYEAQSRLLEEAVPLFITTEEKVLFEDIRKVSGENMALFGELVKNIEHGSSQTIIQELNNRITVKVQARVSDALRLSKLSSAEVNTIEYQFEFFVAILGILIVAISIGSYIVSISIAKSLRVLHEGAEIIAKGNLDYQVNIKSHDEIGQLARAFNNMAVKLKESYQGLERKVEERTVQLDAANQQLKASNQQLRASNQQLDASTQQLRAANQQLSAAESGLKEKVTDLEIFNKAAVGRELKMIELKKEIEELRKKS